jgi:hypothetical protein
LFDDLVECCKRRREAVDRDDTASAGERCVSDLSSRVAAKHAWRAELHAQRAQAVTNSAVELTDGFVFVALG